MFSRNALDQPTPALRRWLVAAMAVVALAVFAFDAATPHGVADGVLYCAVILLARAFRSRRAMITTALLCSALVVAGFFVSPPGASLGWAVLNRILMLVAVWMYTALSWDRIVAHERFRLVMEAAPNGVLIVDHNGTIVLLNAHLERLFGYDRNELLGKPVETLIAERIRRRHVAERAKFLQRPESRPMGQGRDLFAQRKDGTEFPIEIGLNPLRTPTGNFVLASVVDITERKHGEGLLARHAGDLQAVNDELRRSNSDLDAFANIASHDLQEPIRTLTSYLALLRQDLGAAVTQEVRTDVHFIEETARRMNTLVQDLLAFSRSGRKSMTCEPVALEDCVSEALLSLAARVNETSAEIHHDSLPTVAGDKTLLTQIYQNLLGNALKFTAEGRHPVVHLTVEPAGADYVLGVKDNGIGIDPQYAKQIFEPFKRLHGRTAYPGSGIGLALCRRAVERHGGRIWVESDLGQGALFRFTLPIPGPIERSHAGAKEASGRLVGRR